MAGYEYPSYKTPLPPERSSHRLTGILGRPSTKTADIHSISSRLPFWSKSVRVRMSKWRGMNQPYYRTEYPRTLTPTSMFFCNVLARASWRFLPSSKPCREIHTLTSVMVDDVMTDLHGIVFLQTSTYSTRRPP